MLRGPPESPLHVPFPPVVSMQTTPLPNPVDSITFSIGDDGKVFNHPEFGSNSSSIVRGLAPSCAGHKLSSISSVSSLRHA